MAGGRWAAVGALFWAISAAMEPRPDGRGKSRGADGPGPRLARRNGAPA